MTRVLSDLLGAREPGFRLGLNKLELAHGRPSADIRLTSELLQTTVAKLKQLGLDPHDTSSEELYQALQERLKADDARLEKRLRTLAATYISAEGDVVAGMVHALKQLPLPKQCFALKASVAKRLLKKQPPKRAMKQLGYRSLDSMLKQQPASAALAAAWLTESPAWRRSWLEQYKNLKPRDFESRTISIFSPPGAHWQHLASNVVATKKHNLLVFKELGSVVVLPLPANRPPGSTTATLALALHGLNDIHASSSFLKLAQVRKDFGKIVQTVAAGEPQLQAHVLDQSVPWHIIQRYYARMKHLFSQELFEPHIQAEDLSWHSIERVLSRIEPSFEFWHNTAYLGLLRDGQTVSFNILDAALNYCNSLPFANRIVHYSRSSLWHELILRYLKHSTVEKAVASELQPELATEEVLV